MSHLAKSSSKCKCQATSLHLRRTWIHSSLSLELANWALCSLFVHRLLDLMTWSSWAIQSILTITYLQNSVEYLLCGLIVRFPWVCVTRLSQTVEHHLVITFSATSSRFFHKWSLSLMTFRLFLYSLMTDVYARLDQLWNATTETST